MFLDASDPPQIAPGACFSPDSILLCLRSWKASSKMGLLKRLEGTSSGLPDLSGIIITKSLLRGSFFESMVVQKMVPCALLFGARRGEGSECGVFHGKPLQFVIARAKVYVCALAFQRKGPLPRLRPFRGLCCRVFKHLLNWKLPRKNKNHHGGNAGNATMYYEV